MIIFYLQRILSTFLTDSLFTLFSADPLTQRKMIQVDTQSVIVFSLELTYLEVSRQLIKFKNWYMFCIVLKVYIAIAN